MSDWRERVEVERAELSQRMSGLEAYLATAEFVKLTYLQQQLLLRQYEAMTVYRQMLTARLTTASGGMQVKASADTTMIGSPDGDG